MQEKVLFTVVLQTPMRTEEENEKRLLKNAYLDFCKCLACRVDDPPRIDSHRSPSDKNRDIHVAWCCYSGTGHRSGMV